MKLVFTFENQNLPVHSVQVTVFQASSQKNKMLKASQYRCHLEYMKPRSGRAGKILRGAITQPVI